MFGRMVSLIEADPSQYDPYFNNTVLLLIFEQTLTDDSPKVQTVSTSTVLYSTSTVKFGTASYAFSYGPSWLNVANTSSFYFGTGDFTIETWINLNTGITWGSGNVAVFDISQQQNGINGGPSVFLLTTSSRTTVSSYQVGYYDNTAIGSVFNPTVLPTGQWFHICTGRQGGTVYVGVNGILSNLGTSTKNWFPYNVKIRQDGYNENGYTAFFDEFRVTSGVWRYGTGSSYPVPNYRFPRQQ